MSKGRLIKAAACGALALALTWTGCDGKPTPEEKAVKRTAALLAAAAPDEWEWYESARAALIEKAPNVGRSM